MSLQAATNPTQHHPEKSSFAESRRPKHMQRISITSFVYSVNRFPCPTMCQKDIVQNPLSISFNPFSTLGWSSMELLHVQFHQHFLQFVCSSGVRWSQVNKTSQRQSPSSKQLRSRSHCRCGFLGAFDQPQHPSGIRTTSFYQQQL